MVMYCLCLLGPTGKTAKVLRYRARSDEGALAIAAVSSRQTRR